MEKLISELDRLAGIKAGPKVAVWFDRISFLFLLIMFLAAPHSIAATQIAWSLGMLFWIFRFFIKPRPSFVRTALIFPIVVFASWTVITAIFSYAPDISVDKLRGTLLFLIFFFAVNKLRTKKAAKLAAFSLIFSCMVNVIWMPIERLIGRGVEVHNLSAESPLVNADMKSGDTIVKVNGKKVSSPEQVLAEFTEGNAIDIFFYRPDFYLTRTVKKKDMLAGDTPLEKLGVGSWKKSRIWRSSGFYGHYATYAEVLQLIGSLLFGLFLVGFAAKFGNGKEFDSGFIYSNSFLVIQFLCLGLIGFALLLTATRASQAAFMLSAFVIVLLGANRKLLLGFILIAIPVAFAGTFYLQRSRNVDFVDDKDNSTIWRQTVYREGFQLWTKTPRNFVLGVGMDSIRRFKDEWGLFDKGKLPPGHFHSTPLQLLVERGFPSLLFWLWILGVYSRNLWRGLRSSKSLDLVERGIILGCFGGLIGFFVSGLVHYNFGDSEVLMIFLLLMGTSVFILDTNKITNRNAPSSN